MALKTLINAQSTDQISFLDRGLQYGDGVFETIAVENGSLLCWEEHLNRLESGCQRLKIPSIDKSCLKSEATSLLNSTERGVIKIIITRGEGGRGYTLPDNPEPNKIISLYSYPVYPEEYATEGVSIRVCKLRYAKNPNLAGIKHLNRLEQVLARSEWNDTSIAEGIVLDQENNVIEGTMSNLFCVIDNVLCTPDLTESGVEGIIRNKVIEISSTLNIETEIKKISEQALENATEVFLCNSVIGIWPVTMIDDKSYSVGDKTRQIQQTLKERNFIPSL